MVKGSKYRQYCVTHRTKLICTQNWRKFQINYVGEKLLQNFEKRRENVCVYLCSCKAFIQYLDLKIFSPAPQQDLKVQV